MPNNYSYPETALVNFCRVLGLFFSGKAKRRQLFCIADEFGVRFNVYCQIINHRGRFLVRAFAFAKHPNYPNDNPCSIVVSERIGPTNLSDIKTPERAVHKLYAFLQHASSDNVWFFVDDCVRDDDVEHAL